LPPAYKMEGPSTYIEGFPFEFDLIVVDAKAKPMYLAVEETINPIKKKDAIRYAEITIKALHPYGVYILKDTRSKYINSGEWEHFLANLTADLN